MASTNPPIRATAYTTYVSLVSQADTKLFKTSVTLAAGDVTVSKDGGAFANIGSLPTEISTTGVLSLALTNTEMTADTVVVRFRDAAGAEWADLLLTLHTVAANFDSLNTDVDAILADTGTDGVIVASLAANSITATAIADNAIDAGSIATGAITSAKFAAGAIDAAAIATNAIDDDALSADAVTAIQSGLATAAALDTVDNLLDTEMPALTVAVADLPTNAELATALGTADDAVLAAIAALNNLSAAQVLAAALTETYAAEGAAPTLQQAVLEILQFLTEKTVAATTVTVKKRDGSTTAATYTLNDASTPTAITRGT